MEVLDGMDDTSHVTPRFGYAPAGPDNVFAIRRQFASPVHFILVAAMACCSPPENELSGRGTARTHSQQPDARAERR
jgi:hypothetical protein